MNSQIKHKTVVVAGGGHAGIEAALAVARMGEKAIMITMDPSSVGRMSCNPAIGGLAKGHLVKEIDALGGQMGFEADRAGIQFKMLNKSKGRAVWSPRAQIDKVLYSQNIRRLVCSTENLTVVKGEVVGYNVDNHRVCSAVLRDGSIVHCDALIIPSGTFLNGTIHIGGKTFSAGRFGEKPAKGLTDALISDGFELGRLKTGTPPRALSSSIDWEKTDISAGDNNPVPFSVKTKRPFSPGNEPCHIVYTNTASHGVLFESLNLSAMYSGKIKGIGPRYCPSIEDKIVRFSDREAHQLFLEPEWSGSKQIYINGFSTSMPESVQLNSLRKIPALKNISLIRPGYAIEYDYFFPSQLKSTLETKEIGGLFLAGQINGTSGYEEAAAQGLISGINAVLYVRQKPGFVLHRHESYIGVLIDDLVTKRLFEPYRMFTSLAEFRLTLRADTADLRLTEKGYKIGLVSEEQYRLFDKRQQEIQKIESLLTLPVTDGATGKKKSAKNFLKQTGKTFTEIFPSIPELEKFSSENLFTVETSIKYEGYTDRENKRIEKLNKLESIKIPLNFNYHSITSLSSEAKEKLGKIRPETLGQASRIAGISPSDILILNMFLK